MATVPKITEPVGWGTSSLAGHRQIRNLEPDVRSVQTMLKEAPASAGGTPGLAVTGKVSGPSDPTVVAIRQFQQKTFGWQDGVVDPTSKTEAALRAAVGADVPSDRPTPTKQKLDVIIKFQGALGFVRPLQENEVFPSNLLTTYKQKPDRDLIRFGQTTTTIREESVELITQALIFIRAELRDREIGKVFVFGSSSGGRNALDMAAALTREAIPIALVAALDAAFFPNEATNAPDSVPKPGNVPRFNLSGLVTADEKLSFFQTQGNKSESSFRHGNLYTSDMAGHEVHGLPFGFRPRDLTAQVGAGDLRPSGGQTADDKAHISLTKIATPLVHTLIRTKLDAL